MCKTLFSKIHEQVHPVRFTVSVYSYQYVFVSGLHIGIDITILEGGTILKTFYVKSKFICHKMNASTITNIENCEYNDTLIKHVTSS